MDPLNDKLQPLTSTTSAAVCVKTSTKISRS